MRLGLGFRGTKGGLPSFLAGMAAILSLKDKMTCLHVDFAPISLLSTFVLLAQSCLQCPHYLSYRRDFQLL